MDDSDEADDVPNLLDKYSSQMAVIFERHSDMKNGGKLNSDLFIKALTDCGLVPDPLPVASAIRIYNSSLRGRPDSQLDFEGFVECLERCSLMAFAEDPATRATLSPVQAMIRLFQAVGHSRAYERSGGGGEFLLPEHIPPNSAPRLDDVNEEDGDEYEDDEHADDGGDGVHMNGSVKGLPVSELSPRTTDALLRDLFAYYCVGAGAVGSGAPTDSSGRRMGAGRFYKMMRECNVMDNRVTQVEVGAIYKQVPLVPA
jgi:hypothetical protein